MLENRSFRRLGSSREIPLKARVVAATNQDLSALVQAGRFRQDLYQRLAVFPIHIPPYANAGTTFCFWRSTSASSTVSA